MNKDITPIYIVSKGRFKKRLTSDSLTEMKLHHSIVVEEQEYKDYKREIGKNPYVKLIVLDKAYQDNYDTCDDLGYTKSKGPGAARNFAWEHSMKKGAKWHWVMDDNIQCFYIYNHGLKLRTTNGGIFETMQLFCEKYANVLMAGPQYEMFSPQKRKIKIFAANTRIYSCNLIRNDINYRWRGRYNEDTDLSLRILKDGYCTIQFNIFLQKKMPTQTMQGGCNTDFYEKEGTYNKTKMLYDLHPDVTKIAMRYGRVHHIVNYAPFKKNKMIRKSNDKADCKLNLKLKKLHEPKSPMLQKLFMKGSK